MELQSGPGHEGAEVIHVGQCVLGVVRGVLRPQARLQQLALPRDIARWPRHLGRRVRVRARARVRVRVGVRVRVRVSVRVRVRVSVIVRVRV